MKGKNASGRGEAVPKKESLSQAEAFQALVALTRVGARSSRSHKLPWSQWLRVLVSQSEILKQVGT